MNNQHTIVEVKKPDVTFKIVLSVAGMIVLLVLALMFRGVAVYVTAGIGTVIIASGGVAVYLKLQNGRHNIRRLKADTTIIEQKAEQEKIVTRQLALAAMLHETKTGVFVANGMDQWTFVPATAQERKQLGAGEIINITPLENLLDLISGETCVMVYGGRGAGKTTIALHWLAARPGQIIVCDPKPRGHNPWPAENIVGYGGRYAEIERTIYQVRAELARRIENELLHEPDLTLFLDELYQLVIIQKLDVMRPFFEIITIGRDYHIHGGFTSSDKGVKALGIEGMSGLREALTEVRVVKAGQVHQVFVDLGNGEQEAKAPGPYYSRSNGSNAGRAILPELKPEWTTFDICAFEFWRMVKDGESRNEAHRLVFGGRYGGDMVQRLQEWRATSPFWGGVFATSEVARSSEVGLSN